MNKENILNIINKYKLDKDKIVITSSAAMVLLGIKEKTADIDISVSNEYYEELIHKYKDNKLQKEYTDRNGDNVYYVDGIINFGKTWYNKEYIIIDNIKIHTAKSILEIKEELKREKDREDIKMLKEYLKK